MRYENSFVIPLVMVGDEYWIDITNIPSDLYLKSVEALGQDVYGQPFRSGIGDLTITFGTGACILTGIVTNRASAAAGAKILLLDSSAGPTLAPNQLLVTQSDAGGRFRFESLAPKDYLIASFTNLPDDQEWTPKIINLVRRSSVHVWPSKEGQPISIEALHVDSAN
jgi:hypothetical protein